MFFAALAMLGLAETDAAPKPVLYRSHEVSIGLKAGCKVQQVHTPAGKIGSHRAILRCPAAVESFEASKTTGR
jgi:hypothetical protein